MRILIVGAGIGGMTLAALLRRFGLSASLVERAPNFEHAGYMLGLYPLGSRVLHGLDLYHRFEEISIPTNRYEAHNDHGALINEWSLLPLAERFGPILNSTRPQIVHLLRSATGDTPIRFGTSIESISQDAGEVMVRLSDGTEDAYDLVVGADGIHSKVRQLTFGDETRYDTGWGGWVWWADGSLLPESTMIEYWGAGRFLGAYPTQRGAGVFAGAPIEDRFEDPGEGRRERIRSRYAGLGARADALLDAVPEDGEEMFFWRLEDARSSEWIHGRVALLGDAAAAFLPTAGIGASMAMESAAVLADELMRTDVEHVHHALELYVARRKERVERMQNDSRTLARMMFIESAALAAIRNFASRFYSLEGLAKEIATAFDAPI